MFERHSGSLGRAEVTTVVHAKAVKSQNRSSFSQRVECVSAEELDGRVTQLFSIRAFVNTSIFFDPTCQQLSYRTFEATNMCLPVAQRSWGSELLEPMGGGALNHYSFTDTACAQGAKVSWNTSRNGVCFSTSPGDYISVSGIPPDASGPAFTVADNTTSTSFPVAAVAGGIVAAVILGMAALIAWCLVQRRNTSKLTQATIEIAASVIASDTLVSDQGAPAVGLLQSSLDVELRSMSTLEFSDVARKESALNTKFTEAVLKAGQSDAPSNSFLSALEPVPPAYDDEFGSFADGSTTSHAIAALPDKKAFTKSPETWSVHEVSTWIAQFSEHAQKNVLVNMSVASLLPVDAIPTVQYAVAWESTDCSGSLPSQVFRFPFNGTDCTPVDCETGLGPAPFYLITGHSHSIVCVPVQQLANFTATQFKGHPFISVTNWYDPSCTAYENTFHHPLDTCFSVNSTQWAAEKYVTFPNGTAIHYTYADSACTGVASVSNSAVENVACMQKGTIVGIPAAAVAPSPSALSATVAKNTGASGGDSVGSGEVGMIIGGLVGGMLGLAVVIAVAMLLWQRQAATASARGADMATEKVAASAPFLSAHVTNVSHDASAPN
ncbi:hypothetical protein BC830DRAFT_1082406 [Chytriomyces sp. MP71]|nr:hypothetical protein BC830DRAFT_1082406 [Chytriomyces sp. MP71]